MAAMSVGSKVRSSVNAQGLVAGQIYEVTNMVVVNMLWGSYATYTVRGADGVERRIANGHLVLTPVSESFLYGNNTSENLGAFHDDIVASLTKDGTLPEYLSDLMVAVPVSGGNPDGSPRYMINWA